MTIPQRVLFAIPTLEHGGPDRVFFEVISRLDRARFAPELAVYSRTGGYLDQLPTDVPIHVLRRPTRLWSRYPVDALWRLLRKRRPRAVVATQSATLTAGLARRGFPTGTLLVSRISNDVGSIQSELHTGSAKHRLAARLSCATWRRADELIAQSDYMRDELLGLLRSAPEHVHTLHNPIDLERAQHLASASTTGPKGSPSFVTVGRLSAQKGLDVLLDGLALAAAELPGAHVTIVGDGPDRQALQARAQRLGISTMVTFAGFQTNPLPLVRAADFFVLPSRYEGFSNAVLEALALGTPVVVTNCPGANRDMVRNGVDGWLVPTEDPTALGAAMVKAARTPRLDRDAIRAGCAERFRAPRIVSQWNDLLTRITQGATTSYKRE